MKIVFLIRSLDIGGAERQLVTLARELAARGCAVSILCFYGGGALESLLCQSEVELVHLGKTHRWDMVGFLRSLLSELRRLSPDVVHGYMIPANLATLLVKLVSKRPLIIWGIRASNAEYSAYGPFDRLLAWMHSRTAYAADLIIANSRAGANVFRSRNRSVVVIENGIDTRVFFPCPHRRDAQRTLLGFEPHHLVFGRIGRLDPLKDHETFLSAAQIIHAKCPEARFVVLGTGTRMRQEHLLKLATALGISKIVTWLPATPDPACVYNALDVLISSSRAEEGFPNVVAEAMACGVPAVVTDVGESGSVVADARAVVPPQDPQALAGAALMILEKPLRTSDELRQSIDRRFGPAHLAQRTLKAITALQTASMGGAC